MLVGESDFIVKMWPLLLVALFSATGTLAQQSSVWTWKCQEGRCQKQLLEEGHSPQGLEACKLTCDTYSILWPRPTGKVELGRVLVPLDYNTISIVGTSDDGRQLSEEVEELVNGAADIFRNQLTGLFRKLGQEPYGGKPLDVQITIHNSDARSLKMGSDESYELYVSEAEEGHIRADIVSVEFFGARHALETLGQLIGYDDVTGDLLIMRDVNITDSPAFPYRSLGLDTARNYYSVASIKRTIDGMSASKLNNFHWHITDSHSFPFQSQTYPQLTQYGAYTNQQIYTTQDIESVVEYARARGIRVIPEFDAPAHVGEGWQWAGPNVTVCVNAQPWIEYCVEPPCGQLNPTNDTVYEILGGIYKDMFAVFDSDIFHMGGDEVNFDCWRSVPEIVNWMKNNSLGVTDNDFLQLWDMFQKKAYAKAKEASGGEDIPVVLWTSHLTAEGAVDKYLDNKTYIIQIWTTGRDKVIAELVNKGFRVIFSNYDALYFDCGFGAWIGEGNNWCSPYIGWQKVYKNNPYDILTSLGVDVSLGTAARELVLGAEAALWSEQADESSLDGRFWPRAAAMAERLWTNPDEGWQQAEYRLLAHRERLVQRGLQSEALEPQWCYQNEGYCPR
ncbi:chitooligosaccharidolytic beta-N-acetylglucosaminidase isoform X2 [Periplaneta americana]|uniref:chitooligosaccharidolytic beta-N-acetylglucosaminidase isoform X2 n=1 Tax=Periplaneta americana TaxID=6978 RepID=UPI0037E87A4A